METIITIANFVWDIILMIKDTIMMVIHLIPNIKPFIMGYINFLPNEILSVFSTAIVFIIAVFTYRFFK